ncbi:hypothetical protein EJ06DRAFT_500561 [Trichodelitschia bisporula]|uniref:Uncharacterized protein n=1 Tax=Trichodelitschia bisporula TaxID=703511 RepID=A0A6G1HJX2_9PEZI|nr:hypothetical protein EJ06DRAFT_500561 [Trichodelitschia bisporula]
MRCLEREYDSRFGLAGTYHYRSSSQTLTRAPVSPSLHCETSEVISASLPLAIRPFLLSASAQFAYGVFFWLCNDPWDPIHGNCSRLITREQEVNRPQHNRRRDGRRFLPLRLCRRRVHNFDSSPSQTLCSISVRANVATKKPTSC